MELNKLNHKQLIDHLTACIKHGTLVYYEAVRLYHARYPLTTTPVEFILNA